LGVRSWSRKSRFQKISGARTATAIVLTARRLSAQRPKRSTRVAMFENQRKFASPCSTHQMGNHTRTRSV